MLLSVSAGEGYGGKHGLCLPSTTLLNLGNVELEEAVQPRDELLPAEVGMSACYPKLARCACGAARGLIPGLAHFVGVVVVVFVVS